MQGSGRKIKIESLLARLVFFYIAEFLTYKTDITINRPFVFAIRETSSGAILFMGKVNKL